MTFAKQRLVIAKENLAKLFKQLDAINQQHQKVTENAHAALELVQKPATQERADLLKTILTSGRPDQASVTRMRDQTAEDAVITTQRQEIESAKQAALDELNEKIRALDPELKQARRVVAEATEEAFREEIEQTLVPEFLKVSEQFKHAFAKLSAAGAAHADLANEFRQQHGISCTDLGSIYPFRTIDMPAPVTSVMRPDTGNKFRIDASQLIDKCRAEFKEKWK